MAKIIPQELRDAGFTAEMFGQTDTSFDQWLSSLIDEQSSLLLARLGTSTYNSAAVPAATYVRHTEKSLCISELWSRRIARKLGQAKGENISVAPEQSVMDKAISDAAFYLCRLENNDYAGEVVETDHSEDAADA
jgi:hypothetical protein